jgi:hypothetical protein
VYPGDLLCILVTPQLACQGGSCPCGGIHQGSACPGQPTPPADDYLRPLRPAITIATPLPKAQGSTLKLVSAGWMRGAGFSRHIRLSPMALASGGGIAMTAAPTFSRLIASIGGIGLAASGRHFQSASAHFRMVALDFSPGRSCYGGGLRQSGKPHPTFSRFRQVAVATTRRPLSPPPGGRDD